MHGWCSADVGLRLSLYVLVWQRISDSGFSLYLKTTVYSHGYPVYSNALFAGLSLLIRLSSELNLGWLGVSWTLPSLGFLLPLSDRSQCGVFPSDIVFHV